MAGGLQYCLHEWKKITLDPFILDAVSHCHIEFDWVPEAFNGATRPYHSFTEAEQTIIGNDINKYKWQNAFLHSSVFVQNSLFFKDTSNQNGPF